MDSLHFAQMLLAWATFTAIGFTSRLFPLVAVLIVAAFVGSSIGVSIAVGAMENISLFLKMAFDFSWTVASHNLVTFIAALVGFVGGASFKRAEY